MGKVVRARFGDLTAHARSAEVIADGIERNLGLLMGLDALRGLSDDRGARAIRAILELREVQQLRANWDLFVALVDSDGYDPADFLEAVEAEGMIDLARHALWGTR